MPKPDTTHINFSFISLKTCNDWLSRLLAGLAVFIIVAPFWPQVTWWMRHDSPAPVQKLVGHTAAPVKAPATQAQINAAGDQLIIPAIDMKETIHEGDKRALRLGVWRRPNTSTPDGGGNTVIVGHRFTYAAGAAVFYNLDKIQVNDPITLTWRGRAYIYKVTETKVVAPSELSVEAATQKPRLTLYTCTPLWTSKSRLVIVAEPVEAS